MSDNSGKYIWHNGQMVPWEEAKVHVLVHALHYGSSVFEGIRAYKTPDGTKIFRLTDHLKRLYNSAKIYSIVIPYTLDVLVESCKEVVLSNKLTADVYIRPIAFRGLGDIGLAPKSDHPVEVAIAAIAWEPYLGSESLEQGVDVCISSWQRVSPNTIPTGAKAGGNYLSSTLISTEANRLGFAEGIALTTDGTVSEGAGENIFIVQDGVLITPPSSESILTGITRDTVINISKKLNIPLKEQAITREALYLADEVFFTGTAAEITPIRSIDRITIGNGSRGSVTRMLQKEFFGLFTLETADEHGWLEDIDKKNN